MRSGFVLLVLSYIVYAQALECGILNLNNDQFRKVMTECVKDNQTLNKIWNMTSSDETEDSSESSEEEIPVTRGINNNKAGRLVPTKRTKRSRGSRFNNDSPMSNVQRKYGGMSPSTTEESTTIVESESEENTNNISNSEDTCILQCVFEKLELTDSNGLPDHKKFADALLKSTSGRELRNFVQESTDECFQQMDSEDAENPCQYSSKLITCLTDKGKSNCDDWPIEDISIY
nr:odorant binding protein 6 [Pachyrhinus yasumatsui]